MQNKNFFNQFENMAKQMPNFMDMGRMREQASRNVEAATAASQIAAEGMQAIARRTAEVSQRNAQNAMECARDAFSSKSMEEAQRIQGSFVSEMMHACCGNAREVTEMASKAAMEMVDIWNKAVADAVCDLTNCTTQHGAGKANGNAGKK